MSAIWGLISNNTISSQTISNMQQSMQDFKIDHYDHIIQPNVYFACGHQYFTNESMNDKSPIYDEKSHVYFTGDCFLYNRAEVIQALSSHNVQQLLPNEDLSLLGDVHLSYLGFLLWGESFVTHLKGSFSFAIYDTTQKTLLLYTDHLACRYLAYYIDKQDVCFSTVYQPIHAFCGKSNLKLSKEWIATAYTDCTSDTLKIPGATVYDNIYHIEAGHYVKIDLNSKKVTNITYWNPLNSNIRLYKATDQEYKELFNSTFNSVIKGMLRARNNTGISLSGGLDSSAVAGFAAVNLKAQGKNLYSYTAIPADDYPFQNTRFSIENEKDFILAQQKMHPNIIPSFINVSEKNCFTNMKMYIKTYCQPIKNILNMVNIEGILLAASKDNCSLYFTGQHGNATISYGSILSYIYQKCMKLQFIAAYKEANAFCKFRKVSRKKLLQVFLDALRSNHSLIKSLDIDCLLSESDIKKYKLVKLEQNIMRSRGTGLLDSRRQRRNFCFMPLVFQHMGFFDTYSSLKYGVLSLDPTLSVDMIELCLRLPIECHVKNGKERRAVRDYMKGYVPDVILDNHTGRGVQGADFDYRVNRDWDMIKDDIYRILQTPELYHYLDKNKVDKLIQEAKENANHMNKHLVARLAVISSLAYFIHTMSEK